MQDRQRPGQGRKTVLEQPHLRRVRDSIHGPLAIRWTEDTTGQFHLQVVAPTGTGGEVWVPAAATNSPLTPGATFLRHAGNYDVYRVESGTFEFSSAS
jgi:hypothetical protein